MHSATSETDAHVQCQGFSIERSAQKGSSSYNSVFSLRRVTEFLNGGTTGSLGLAGSPSSSSSMPKAVPQMSWNSERSQ